VADQALLGHTNPGTAGAAWASAGAAADPLATVVPGSYAPGTAGYRIGTNLDAQVSSRSTLGGTAQSGDLYSLMTSADAEPASVPAANASPIAKLGFIFARLRNKKMFSAGTERLRNDADTADIGTSSVTDTGTGGTTTSGKWQ
jgi:hypothetical protein